MEKDFKSRIREAVRDRYGKIATTTGVGCGCCSSSGSGEMVSLPADKVSGAIGYSKEELKSVPEGANLGLGCGNPQAIAELKPGETVLDLGSGAGFDCFLAAGNVGEAGHVIGVDMTSEMIVKARQNAAKVGIKNVEFRLGEIEHLPAADGSIDVIISNCVVNLSPDKPDVFNDAFRVLKPGGRLAISDIVALQPLPQQMREDLALISGCVGGASPIEDLERMLHAAGFIEIDIQPLNRSRKVVGEWFPGRNIGDYIASATIKACKPAGDNNLIATN